SVQLRIITNHDALGISSTSYIKNCRIKGSTEVQYFYGIRKTGKIGRSSANGKNTSEGRCKWPHLSGVIQHIAIGISIGQTRVGSYIINGAARKIYIAQ